LPMSRTRKGICSNSSSALRATGLKVHRSTGIALRPRAATHAFGL
jgi:hypothetical protein